MSDGFPEKIVDAQPQSVSISFRVDCIFVVDEGFEYCRFLVADVATGDPLLDPLGWLGEKAATSLVDADKAKSRNAAILILFVDIVGGFECDYIRRRTSTTRLRSMPVVFRLEQSVFLSNMVRPGLVHVSSNCFFNSCGFAYCHRCADSNTAFCENATYENV